MNVKDALSSSETLDLYRKSGALLEGHFILSSGLHSSCYLQSAIVLSEPNLMRKLCKGLAYKISKVISINKIDIIVSPALGGVVVGSGIGEELNIKSIFTERVKGVFELRRGFKLNKKDKVLVVEDVITTGKSSKECANCVESYGGEVVAEAAIIDRSINPINFGFPVISLATIDAPLYDSDNLPAELAKIEVIRPGSRKI